MSHQIVQQVEFLGCECHRLAAYLQTAIGRIQLDLAASETTVFWRLRIQAHTSQLGFDSGDQLAWAEWLDHVVVGTNAQAANPVRFFTPCSQQDDRNSYVLASQTSAYF